MSVSKKMRLGLLALVLAGLAAVPMTARAVDVNADDQAHFDFKAGAGHHHPMIWRAAKQLQAAKHTLWLAAWDFNGHKVDAIAAINNALEQLKICESK
jgi:hypothetical protein